MKKCIAMCLLVMIPVMVIGMYKSSEMEQVERMEIVRQIFIKRKVTQSMSTSSSQADDEMSCSSSSSGSFALPTKKQSYSPGQRKSSLKKLIREQDAEKKEATSG